MVVSLTIRVVSDDRRPGWEEHLPHDLFSEATLYLGDPPPGHAELVEQLTPATITVDGVERAARALELDVAEADWILQVDDVQGHRLVVTGDGLRPEGVELIRMSVDDLLERWPSLGRS